MWMDILKHATLIRDPLTFEVNVPFETRPSRTNEMKDLAWKKMHQDAIEHLDGDYLKSQCTIKNSTIDANSMGSITENYCIYKDPDYIKIDHSQATEKLYNYIKNSDQRTFI